MKLISIVIFCLSISGLCFGGQPVSLQNDDNHPTQRSILNLALMAAYFVPCPFPYFPIPYGCFCGITITPPEHPPVDIFDETCRDHDQCYDDGVASGCSILDEYFWNYKWDLIDGQIVCSEENERCQQAFCTCDKLVIEAIAKVAIENDCPSKDPGCPTK